MEIGCIKGAQYALGAPRDWQIKRDGPCEGLPVLEQRENGILSRTSAWIPSAEERAALAAGAPIYLKVLGFAHPPVAVFIGDPPA